MSITGTTTGQGAFSAALSEVKSAEELQVRAPWAHSRARREALDGVA
jgi:hypothetical protein